LIDRPSAFGGGLPQTRRNRRREEHAEALKPIALSAGVVAWYRGAAFGGGTAMANVGWKSPRFRVGLLAGAIVAALTLLASGCQLDRSGIALRPNPAGLAVMPELACPGDTVGVLWNLTGLPRAGENCRRCTTSAGCPAGFGCLDGVCCRSGALAGGSTCDVSGQCLPSTINMTLSADPALALPALPSPLPLRGGVSVAVAGTTDFSAAGSFALPLEGISDRARVRVPVVPDEPMPLQFNFTCAGGGPGWTMHDFAALGPTTSDLIRIEAIRNASRFAVMLTGGEPSRGPVRIEPGDATTAFAGLQPRGRWFAFIPADARPGPPPVCSPTTVMNPLPDINVEMRVGCRTKP
jgi:hypothetical protein